MLETEQEVLLGDLLSDDSALDLPTRTAKICDAIDAYPVQDVRAPLSFCEKLICSDDAAVVSFGYSILAALARYDECTQAHRVHFFTELLHKDSSKHSYHRRTYLFSYLTDGGRNIEGFLGVLPIVILHLYDEANSPDMPEEELAMSANKLGLTNSDALEVLTTIIKFNATFLSDEAILRLVNYMCEKREQTHPQKLVKAISVVDSLIIYAHLPRAAVPALTQLLSFWMGKAQVAHAEEQEKKCWSTFVWLLSTHLRDLSIDNLFEHLDDESKEHTQSRGAALLLYRSLTDVQTRPSIMIDWSRILEVLGKPPTGDLLEHACVRLTLLKALLEDEEIRRKLILELDWTQLKDTIVINATIPPPSDLTDDDLQNAVSTPQRDRRVDRHKHVLAIVTHIENMEGMSLTQSRILRRIALSTASYLNEKQTRKLIEAYHPSAFRISVGNWLPEIQELAQIFLRNERCNILYRQQALHVVNGALKKAQELGEEDAVTLCGNIILDALSVETHYIFRNNLVHCVISFVSKHFVKKDEDFKSLMDLLLKAGCVQCHDDPGRPATQCNSLLTSIPEDIADTFEDAGPFSGTANDFPSMLPDAGIVVLMMRSIMTHPNRTRMIYDELLNLIADQGRAPENNVMLLRGLFRVRSDIEHHIFFVVSPEGESLATILNRNSREPRYSLRRGSLPSIPEDLPQVWRYGDIQGLPEEPTTSISPVLRSDSPPDSQEADLHLDMTRWLQAITDIIEKHCDWEVYSYIIVHLGAQLSNQSLFTEALPQIKRLARVVCRQIQDQTVMKPPEASGLRQGDVAFCLINILTTLIGYHWHIQRSETEHMISTFIRGLTAWESTGVPCIHALTLCCYELPISLERDLVRIVAQMSTIVTKSEAAIHVLEYLAGLSRLPQLCSRFHGDEIKLVFGVCFSYIEYARGKRYDEAQLRAGRSAGPTRQGSIASGQRPSTEDIPQYVFAISYHVITFWYLTLQPEDQRKYLPWMEQRLLSKDQAGHVEEEGLVTLDHVWRVSQGRDMRVPAAALKFADLNTNTWVSEYCILTITCHTDEDKKETVVEVLERRASGTDLRQLPRAPGILNPEDVFVQNDFSTTMDGPFKSSGEPQTLPVTEATKRSLAVFDRANPVDFFKAGVIYIGESQTQEAEILSNISGSPDYNLFLRGLGHILNLPNHKGNVAGLDTSEDAFDGYKTYQHNDSVSTLNYHITTLMPTNRSTDPLCTRKKSHIGNDYVNIVWNNSGLGVPFDFHTFPSAFNYVYIVITPEARQTFIQTRTRSKHDPLWFGKSWFRVQVVTREDFPDISSAAETKVVSGAALASYVRNLALNAEVFCRVWTNRGSGEYPSSWRSRLAQIRVLRERAEKMAKEEKGEKGE